MWLEATGTGAGAMLIRLLGPVDVLADDGPREVRGLRRKAALAALALHGGEVVSAGSAR